MSIATLNRPQTKRLSHLSNGWGEPASFEAVRQFMGLRGYTAYGLDLTPAAGRVVSRVTGSSEELEALYGNDVPNVLDGAPVWLPSSYADRTIKTDLRSPWDAPLVARGVASSYVKDGPNPRCLGMVCPPGSATGIMRLDAMGALWFNRVTGEIGSLLMVWHALMDDLTGSFASAMTANGGTVDDLFVVTGAAARLKFYLDRDAYEMMAACGPRFRDCMERVFGVTIKRGGIDLEAYANLDLGRLSYLLIQDAGVPFDQIDFDAQCTRTTRDEEGTLLLASKRTLEELEGKDAHTKAPKPGALLAASTIYIGG